MIRVRIFVTFHGERFQIRPPTWMTAPFLRKLVSIYRENGYTSIHPMRCK